MVFCLGTEDFKGSLFRNGCFICFSVKELKFPMVPYLEMCFTCFSVYELNVPNFPYLEMRGTNVFLFRN